MAAKQQIGPLLLGGLIIGPILGSGIIILPPLAYEIAGPWALAAWLLTIFISMLFAWVFCRLSLLYPGSGGISTAVEHAFGRYARVLTSTYLIGAVFFGPVAVMLTAGEWFPEIGLSPARVGMLLTLVNGVILLREVSFIGRISLLLSSLAACTLFFGSVETLWAHGLPQAPTAGIAGKTFIYTLLLLFWSVVGWEVIGNYSGEVQKPDRNLPRATFGSAVVIAMVTLTVAMAVQSVFAGAAAPEKMTVAAVVAGLFGQASLPFMALLTVSLCVSTYLLFVGGVARLIASLAEERLLPFMLAGKTSGGSPYAAILLLAVLHLLLLGLVEGGLLTVAQLVVVADGFFLANALICVLAALKLLTGKVVKIVSLLLAAMLLLILLRSSGPVLAIIGALAVMLYVRTGRVGGLNRLSDTTLGS